MNSTDLKQIRSILKEELAPIETRLGGVEKRLDKHEKILKSLKKTQDTMLKVLDGEQMHQRKRIKRIEDHIGLPALAS